MTTALQNPKAPRHGGRFGPATLDDMTESGRRLLDQCYQSCRAFLTRCPSPPDDVDSGLYRSLYYLIRYSGLVSAADDQQHLYNAFQQVLTAAVVNLKEDDDPYTAARLLVAMYDQLKLRLAAAELNAEQQKRRAAAAETLSLYRRQWPDAFGDDQQDFTEGDGI